jgi:hypothetical protein
MVPIWRRPMRANVDSVRRARPTSRMHMHMQEKCSNISSKQKAATTTTTDSCALHCSRAQACSIVQSRRTRTIVHAHVGHKKLLDTKLISTTKRRSNLRLDHCKARSGRVFNQGQGRGGDVVNCINLASASILNININTQTQNTNMKNSFVCLFFFSRNDREALPDTTTMTAAPIFHTSVSLM